MKRIQYLVTKSGVKTGHLVSYSTDGTISFETDGGRVLRGRVEDFHTNRADAMRAHRHLVGRSVPGIQKRMN